MRHVGIIDIGSNTIRLVIYQRTNGEGVKQVENIKKTARLSAHMDKERKLDEAGISLLIKLLTNFQEILQFYQASEVQVVATAAFRQAENRTEIIQRVRQVCGLQIRLLSGEEEAYYGYLAVVHSMGISKAILMDMGGASTELVYMENRRFVHYHSFPFGTLTLQQRFFAQDVPTEQELVALHTFLAEQFATLPWLKECQLPLIGIGGSARNIGLIHLHQHLYPLSDLHQYELDPLEVGKIVQMLSSLPQEKRQKIEGLSKDRTLTIIPASQTIKKLLELMQASHFIISGKGLRDGLFYASLQEKLADLEHRDIALQSVQHLAQAFQIESAYREQIERLSFSLFDQLVRLGFIADSTKLRRLLRLASQVYYLGTAMGWEGKSGHTFYLLSQRLIEGLSAKERLMLASIAAFQTKAELKKRLEPFQGWFSKDELNEMELVGSILKLVYHLERTKRLVVEDLACQVWNKKLSILIFQRQSTYFEQEYAVVQKRHLEKALKLEVKLIFQDERS